MFLKNSSVCFRTAGGMPNRITARHISTRKMPVIFRNNFNLNNKATTKLTFLSVLIKEIKEKEIYVVGYKIFGLTYKSRAKWKMLWGVYSAICGEVNVSVSGGYMLQYTGGTCSGRMCYNTFDFPLCEARRCSVEVCLSLFLTAYLLCPNIHCLTFYR